MLPFYVCAFSGRFLAWLGLVHRLGANRGKNKRWDTFGLGVGRLQFYRSRFQREGTRHVQFIGPPAPLSLRFVGTLLPLIHFILCHFGFFGFFWYRESER
jgi:hypothetical protein